MITYNLNSRTLRITFDPDSTMGMVQIRFFIKHCYTNIWSVCKGNLHFPYLDSLLKRSNRLLDASKFL